jgi:23S rRNA pseudouridine1911/1915/1917 synthase
MADGELPAGVVALESLDEDEEAPEASADPASEALAVGEPKSFLAATDGDRLDRLVASVLATPRNRVQRWIDLGLVTVDGRVGRSSQTLRQGQRVVCAAPAPVVERLEAEDLPLQLLHEDADLLALDKPAGIAVHPGAGRPGGTLANALLFHFPEIAGVGGPGRPGIVHRLDLDTTGVLLVARTDRAYQALIKAFAERRIAKRYFALVHGVPRPERGTIDLPIGRHPQERQRMTLRPDGRPARTHYQVAAARLSFSLLGIDLETGRTHQIRVHAKAIGHPLIGDPLYGEARWRSAPRPLQKALAGFSRPALHARRLELDHPISGLRLTLESPWPADLVDLWRRLTGDAWPADLV